MIDNSPEHHPPLPPSTLQQQQDQDQQQETGSERLNNLTIPKSNGVSNGTGGSSNMLESRPHNTPSPKSSTHQNNYHSMNHHAPPLPKSTPPSNTSSSPHHPNYHPQSNHYHHSRPPPSKTPPSTTTSSTIPTPPSSSHHHTSRKKTPPSPKSRRPNPPSHPHTTSLLPKPKIRPLLTRSSSAPLPPKLDTTPPSSQHHPLETLLNTDTQFAFPSRKRSISTHSGDGAARGVEGLLHDLAKQDAELEDRERRKALRRQQRAKQAASKEKMAALEREREARKERSLAEERRLRGDPPPRNPPAPVRQNLGYAMERFLSDGCDVPSDAESAVSRTRDVLEAIRSTSPSMAPAGVMINTADPTLDVGVAGMMGEMVMPCGSSATSSLLSDLMVKEEGEGGVERREEGGLGSMMDDDVDVVGDEGGGSESDGSLFEDAVPRGGEGEEKGSKQGSARVNSNPNPIAANNMGHVNRGNNIDFLTTPTPTTSSPQRRPSVDVYDHASLGAGPPLPPPYYRDDQLATSYTSSSHRSVENNHNIHNDDMHTTFHSITASTGTARSLIGPPPMVPTPNTTTNNIPPGLPLSNIPPGGGLPLPPSHPPRRVFDPQRTRNSSAGSGTQSSHHRIRTDSADLRRKAKAAAQAPHSSRPKAFSNERSVHSTASKSTNRRIRPGKTPYTGRKKKGSAASGGSHDFSSQQQQHPPPLPPVVVPPSHQSVHGGSVHSGVTPAKSPLVVDGFDYDKYAELTAGSMANAVTPLGTPLRPPPPPPQQQQVQQSYRQMTPPLPPTHGPPSHVHPNPYENSYDHRYYQYQQDTSSLPPYYQQQQQQPHHFHPQQQPQQLHFAPSPHPPHRYSYDSTSQPPKSQKTQQHQQQTLPNQHLQQHHPLLLPPSITIPPPPPSPPPQIRHRHTRRPSVNSLVDSVFSSVRSVSTDDIEADINDSEKYTSGGCFERAIPERFFALMVTLALEIPVLLMISGGGSGLCEVVGRRRFLLLMAFLPLNCAISGNAGLQGSTLTTRAVSHRHVTRSTYPLWLRKELGASIYLALGMGCLLGLFAYRASGNDATFGLTVGVSQFASVVASGLTGTLMPFLGTFIFRREAGKWGGLLETAIQDVVGASCCVGLSYKLLVVLGPMDIEVGDQCHGAVVGV